ncbi:MAG TPA: asparagine synthase-related protein [Acidimicrobiales bacterium]|nr:asparagine synthase-related protein [Acidimicrobiales bacterium]
MGSVDARWPVPTDVEVLSNLLLGHDRLAAALPPATGAGWRAAIEQALLPALARTPCVVSFSGGRDSSAVLALAVDTARRHGLPLPVPVSMRFPGMADTDETRWQAVMIDHLKLEDHVVLELSTELDALGDNAVSVLRDVGVRWPGNAYMHAPVFEAARGGAVITGVGGDELFGSRGSHLVLALHREERPTRRDVALAGAVLAPPAIRAIAWRRRHGGPIPWLTSRGEGIVNRALAADAVRWPQRWNGSLRHWVRSRAFAAVCNALPLIGEHYDVAVTNAFVVPTVLAELLPEGGPTGFASRADAMGRLLGDLLPPAVRDRTTKAGFSAPAWGPRARAFAGNWDGAGVDPDLVDIEALKWEWQSTQPDFRSVLLLHRAWLAGQASAASN